MTFPDYREIYGVTSQQIRDASEQPQAGAAALRSVAEEMANDHLAVTTNADGAVQAPTSDNVTVSQELVNRLAGNGAYVAGIIKYFADKVDVFDRKVDEINTKWSARVRSLRNPASAPDGIPFSYSDAAAKANNDYVGEYNTAIQLLDQDADDVERMLVDGGKSKNVLILVREGLIDLAGAASLGVEVKVEDQFQFWQATFARAGIADFARMTEAERKRFNADYPAYLTFLMGVEDPTDEMKVDVLALAVPKLDGADGKASVHGIRRVLHGEDGPGEFEAILRIVGEFGDYARWAQKHGGYPIFSDQTAYLREFYAGTGGLGQSIQDFIATGVSPIVPQHRAGAGFSPEQQSVMLQQYANGLMVLSDEDLTTGGGWAALPEELREAVSHPTSSVATSGGDRLVGGSSEFLEWMPLLHHSDIAGGDDFSRTLGAAAHVSMSATMDDGPYDSTDTYQGDPTIDQYALELVSRNHQASHDLITGDNMSRVSVYNDVGVSEPFNATDFIRKIYSMSWDDDGSAAASLTAWTALTDGTPEEGLGDATYQALFDVLAGDQGVYDSLISFDNGPNRGDSLGEVNPQLARSLALQTGVRLDQFDTNPASPADEAQRIKMLMLINSDHATDADGNLDANSASVMLNALIQNYENQRVRDSLDPDHVYAVGDPHQRSTVGEDNGRLEGYATAAMRNVYYADYTAEVDAQQAIAAAKLAALDQANAFVAFAGVGGPAGGHIAAIFGLVTSSAGSFIAPDIVEIPEIPDLSVVAGNPITADDEGIQFTSRIQYVNALLASDPTLISTYSSILPIDPATNTVDVTGVTADSLTKINDELEGVMAPNINQEIDEMVKKRGQINGVYTLAIPDEFAGR